MAGSIRAFGRLSLGCVGVGALLLVGCHPHVVLSAPASGDSFEERAEAYDELKPVSMHETHTTYLKGGTVVGASRTTDYLQLANGTRVYHAEDLLPVLPENAPASEAARRSESAASTGGAMRGAAVALYVGGVAAATIPLVTKDTGSELNTTPMFLGLGAMAVGLVLHLVGNSFASTANDEKATTFELYDKGLRKRLDLCVQNDQLGDCRAAGRRRPAPAAPQEPDEDDQEQSPSEQPAPQPESAPAPGDG